MEDDGDLYTSDAESDFDLNGNLKLFCPRCNGEMEEYNAGYANSAYVECLVWDCSLNIPNPTNDDPHDLIDSVCLECYRPGEDHANGQCLFAPTTLKEIKRD